MTYHYQIPIYSIVSIKLPVLRTVYPMGDKDPDSVIPISSLTSGKLNGVPFSPTEDKIIDQPFSLLLFRPGKTEDVKPKS